ncbi:EAL domain-containing protein [Erythrobacter sp. 3-20A1M]|uniref:EAL domain-containing protein n=1 Tax=Erythrobacter sp. 3-20A1M TaxID=2653850 RepID=UPI0035303CCA
MTIGDTLTRDPLTGLLNYESARDILHGWLSGSGEGPQIHAMLVGLGRFDAVNLAYGEAAGDGALAEVAQRLLHFSRDEFELQDSLVSRLGGGKFLLVARGTCSRERWQWLAEALADALSGSLSPNEAAPVLKLWPRLALMRAVPGDDAGLMLDRLADAMGDMQGSVGRRIGWIDREAAPAGTSGARLEADLLKALAGKQINLCFQPQFDGSGRIAGAEALARWDHPELGRIGAGTLFAIAERADQTASLSRAVAEMALSAASEWPDGLDLSLNITSADLAVPDLARALLALADDAGFPIERLVLEITEQVLVTDLELAADTLAMLRAAGARIALDDFGAGFCNFRYLKVLPLDYLKLDQAMVEGIADDPRDWRCCAASSPWRARSTSRLSRRVWSPKCSGNW